MLLLLLKFYNPQLAVLTGAKNWFYIAGFSFQPTELVKIGYTLMLAKITVNYQQNLLLVIRKMIGFIYLKLLLLLFQ